MTTDTWPEEEEVKSLQMKRPHLVILGAGASVAAFPAGDPSGTRLPVMCTFTETVGLTALLREAGIPGPYDDFEAIYSDIAVDPSRERLKAQIESLVYSYFASLSLPDEPTLYDHLVLSLRPKDVIATSEKLIALMILVQGWENDDSSGSWSASGHTTPLAKREGMAAGGPGRARTAGTLLIGIATR